MSDQEQDPTLAPIIPLIPRDRIDAHVQALIDLTQLGEFKGDPARQAQTFERMQVLWPSCEPQHRQRIREHTCRSLNITESRFDYLIACHSSVDLELGLRYSRLPFTRNDDERIYPDYRDGWLGRYLHYAEVGECPVGWHHWSGLVALSAACRRNFYLLAGHKRMYPNLYVLLEGPSGYGKNTAIERAQDLLVRMNDMLAVRHANDGDRMPTIALLPHKLTPPRLFAGLKDARKGYRLIGKLAGQQMPEDYESAGVLIAPEASTLLSRDQFGADQLIVLLTQAYDGYLEDDTEKRGLVRLRNVVLSILLGSTMSWLRKNITDTVFEGGFLGARCLSIPKGWSGRSYAYEPLIDPIERTVLVEGLAHYASHHPVELRLSPQADRLYQGWYEKQDRSTHADDRIASYFGRKRVYLLKLAMLYCLSRWHVPTIEEADMHSAMELLEFEEPTILRSFQQMLTPEGNSHQEKVLLLLKKHGGKLRYRDAVNILRNTMTSQQIGDSFTVLQSSGLLLSGHWKAHERASVPARWLYLPDMWDEHGNRVFVRPGAGGSGDTER